MNPQDPQLTPADQAIPAQKPGNTLGILSIVFAIVFAPVGFILSIFSMIKGFGNNNNTLGVMGVIATALSTICGTVLFVVLIAAFSAFETRNIGPANTQTVSVNNVQFTLPIPAKMVKDDQGDDGVAFGMNGMTTDGKKTYTSQVVLSGTKDMTPEKLALAKQAIDGTSNEYMDNLDRVIQDSIESQICVHVKLEPKQKITVQGAETAFRMPFSCETDEEDPIQSLGYYIIAFNDSTSYDVLITAIKPSWDANIKVWDSISYNIGVEDK